MHVYGFWAAQWSCIDKIAHRATADLGVKGTLEFWQKFCSVENWEDESFENFYWTVRVGAHSKLFYLFASFFFFSSCFFFFFNLKVGAHKEFYNFIYSSSHFYRSTLTV